MLTVSGNGMLKSKGGGPPLTSWPGAVPGVPPGAPPGAPALTGSAVSGAGV